MKNLNKKLSVIALSGMAVFGGVAISGVQAFADSRLAVEQEIQDEGIDKLNQEIKGAHYKQSSFSYKVIKRVASKNEARDVLRGYNRANRSYMPPVDKNNIGKCLKRFSDSGARAFALQFEGDWYIVGLPDLLK